MIAALAGLAAGILHVLSGPDHLAAVGTLAIEERRRTWAMGFVWGVGHTSGVWIVGALVLVLRAFLPLEQMASWSDYLASFGLVGIGLWGLYKGLAHRIHAHEHAHEGKVHMHHHAHRVTAPGAHGHVHVHTHVACGLGILHGLAGSSHFLGILPALDLTPTELKLLVHLMERQGQVQTREERLCSVWGHMYSGYSRTVDTHIRRLREKLGEASGLVETLRGVGYRFRG